MADITGTQVVRGRPPQHRRRRRASCRDLWEDELLANPAAVGLLSENGGYLFEDSLHLTSYQLWTDDFFEQFETRRGYDLRPYLPTILVPDLNNFFVGGANADTKLGTFEYAPGVGQKIRNDYYQTLTDLYVENHIVPMREWAAGYNLGLGSALLRPVAGAVGRRVRDRHPRDGVVPAGRTSSTPTATSRRLPTRPTAP